MTALEAPSPVKVIAADFERWAALPEHIEQRHELINGEIVEVTSNSYSSMIAGVILTYLNLYMIKNDLGYVTGADGGYAVGEARFMPDVGVVLKARHPELPRVAYLPFPPDLAVEVASPSDTARRMFHKVNAYQRAGTVTWVVWPDDKTIDVYAPGEMPRTFDVSGALDGGALLPGFALPLKDVFR
ncbi:MAG: Uma2 family endonuclease [bacterium]|nr:Uma2 family endonuclease [bacterium]